MKKITTTALLLFFFAKLFAQLGTPILPGQLTGMVGYWDFENAGSLFQSTSGLGLDLVLGGGTGSITQIPGPGAGDMAIAKTTGKYLVCNHAIQ